MRVLGKRIGILFILFVIVGISLSAQNRDRTDDRQPIKRINLQKDIVVKQERLLKEEQVNRFYL